MTLASDSYNQGISGPARGLGPEERVAKVLRIASAVFGDRKCVVDGWAAQVATSTDDPDRAAKEVLINDHAAGIALVQRLEAALEQARRAPVAHQRQHMAFAVPAGLAQAAATEFLDRYEALVPSTTEEVAPAQPPAPAPAAAATRPKEPPTLQGLFRKFAGAIGQQSAPVPVATASDQAANTGRRILAELGESVAEVRKVYIYTVERMTYVEQALLLRHRSLPPGDLNLPNADAQQRALIVALLGLFENSPPIFQRCQVAAGQTTAVRRDLLRAEQSLQRLSTLTPEAIPKAAPTVEIAVLRGKAVPLANFPRTFQADPILRQLFPPSGSPPTAVKA